MNFFTVEVSLPPLLVASNRDDCPSIEEIAAAMKRQIDVGGITAVSTGVSSSDLPGEWELPIRPKKFIVVLYDHRRRPLLKGKFGANWVPTRIEARMVGDGYYEAEPIDYGKPSKLLRLAGWGVALSAARPGPFRPFGRTLEITAQDTFRLGDDVLRFRYPL